MPDRICVVPRGIFFVECKATGKVATAAQLREHALLRELSQSVYVVDSKQAVDELIKIWRERL